MFGQGGPSGDRRAQCSLVGGCALVLLLTLLLTGSLSRNAIAQSGRRMAAAPPLELRLVVKWGQDAPAARRGRIELTSGRIMEFRHRGSAADGAASYRLRDGRIEVHELSPRLQSELEILVEAPRDAELIVSLQPDGAEGEAHETAIPLARLISKSAQVDARQGGPWLAVSRAPGDVLRILFEEDRRIFTGGASMRIEILPHEVLPEGSGVALPLQLRADMRLVRSRTQEEVWYERREIESDGAGVLPAITGVEIPLPREDGAYEFVIRLENRRFLASGFSPIEHRESLIVLSDAPPTTVAAPWRTVMEIDPTVRSWWDSLRVLPQIKGLPGLSTPPAPVASVKPGVVSRDGRKWASLPAGAWQAIPLTTQAIGEPHVVQFEIPAESSARPRWLLLEQQAGGAVVSIGLDASGLVPDAASAEKPGTRVQSLVYWPTTSTVWLVAAAPQSDGGESRFGAVRLYAGPSQLPPLAPIARLDRGRMLALELPSATWRELFGGDPTSARGAADATYSAAARLTNYLKAKGYNACRLCVAERGKSLYPNEYFDAWGDLGRDIDAVELLLRVLARERLTLAAEFAFNAPLAELESLRSEPDQVVPGADLLLSNGAPLRQTLLGPGGVGPMYNPLDSLVQSAMRSPLEDFLDRYAHHDSFGGLVIRLTPDCYSRLPHEDWGKDSPTMVRFNTELERVLEAAKSRPNQRASYTQPDKRDAWLAWRGEQLATFYLSLQDRVLDARPDARLYLPLGGLLEGEAAEDRIRRWIAGRSPLSDLWLSAGVDPASWDELRETVFLRSTHIRAAAGAQAAILSVAESSEEWRRFQEIFEISGASSHTASSPVTLNGFAERGPFRGEVGNVFAAQLPLIEELSDPVMEGLAAGDPFAVTLDVLVGAPGQPGKGLEWVEIFRRLPPVMMTPAPPRATPGEEKPLPNTPVVLRQATIASRTWFYAVNPCPFPVTINLELEAPAGAKLESLSSQKLPPLQSIGRKVTWSYEMAPRQIIGAAINSPKSKVTSFATSVDRETMVELSQELGALQSRLKFVEQSEMRDYPVLANPDFEVSSGADRKESLFGWSVTRGPESAAQLASPGADSKFCLRVVSDGEWVSIRSAPFPAPKTQRLILTMLLRTEPGERVPEVKLAIEGELDGRPFLKRATVNKSRTLDERWRRIQFQLEHLPDVKNLCVGVDVSGRGVLYVDGVTLSDFWCSDKEAKAIMNQVAVASHALERGRVTQAQRLLSDFWPTYLREHVDFPATARRNRTEERTATKPKEAPPRERESSSNDRGNGILPKTIFPRR